MTGLLNEIIAVGHTTAHTNPFTPVMMREHYLAPALGIARLIALDGDEIVGFQSLEWCDPHWRDSGRRPADWAVIATFVRRDRHGCGIGGKLFEATRAAAAEAGVTAIDATIRWENEGGRSFYDQMGFVDDRVDDETVSKRFDVAQP